MVFCEMRNFVSKTKSHHYKNKKEYRKEEKTFKI